MNRRNVLTTVAAFAALGLSPGAVLAAAPPHRLSVQGAAAGRRVTYPVTVNGKAMTFMLDSGLPAQAVLTAGAAEAAGLPIVRTEEGGDPSGGARIAVKVFRGATLGLGGASFAIGEFGELPPMGGLAGIDGILGLDLFAGMTLSLDFAALTLSAERKPLPAEGSLAFARDPFIVVEARVGERRMKAHLDTGNGAGAFIVPADAVAGLPLTGEARAVGRARTVSSEVEIMAAPLGAPLYMGPFELTAPEVRWPSVVPGMANIGAAAFAGRRLSIDLVNQRVRVDRV